jgi:DNA-binding NtrC family response regulator
MAMPGRVLLVDDEAIVRITLAGALELQGFKVLEADSAEEALRLMATESVDIVISDIRMPGMDGVELTATLRERFPDLPVILVTAFEAEEVLEEAIHRGAYTVISKPCSPDRLAHVIRRAASRPVVLVVDDEAPFAEALVSCLQDMGMGARAATDEASALAALRDTPIDVCVLDLVLDQEDGVSVGHSLRATDGDIIFIGVTGHQDVAHLIHGMMKLGAYNCLPKPLRQGALVRSIGRARRLTSTGNT